MEYYTYAYLREDGTPYYIGKGKGNRAYVKRYGNGRARRPKNPNNIILLKRNITEEEAFKHEKYMIAVFGRKDLGTGILRNLTDGGDGPSGYKYSKERKEKWKGKNHPFYGKTHSEETREKIRQSKIGDLNPAKRIEVREKIKKNHSSIKYPELPKIIGQKLKGRKNPEHSKRMTGIKNPMYGKKRPEHSQKMTGENNPNYCKGSFYEVISPGGEIGYTCRLETFCKYHNLDRGAIAKVINYQARHHKGWTVNKVSV